MNKFIFTVLTLAAVMLALVECRKPPPALYDGGIYSAVDREGGFHLVKLLGHHKSGDWELRWAWGSFHSRPTAADVPRLSPGLRHEFELMSETLFLERQPVLIVISPVTPEERQELEGWEVTW